MTLKMIKNISNIFIALLISIGVLVVLSFSSMPGGFNLFTVMSGSMEPALHTGSVIFVKSAESYEIQDIITRKTLDPEVTVTHRIVEINIQDETDATIFITKGDANDMIDNETVSEESIIGKVVFDIPYLGYLVGYAQTQQGFILLIIIPAVIIIYEEILKIKTEIRKKIKAKKSSKKKNDHEFKYVFHKKEAIDDAPEINKD